jgi:hypothetical protein
MIFEEKINTISIDTYANCFWGADVFVVAILKIEMKIHLDLRQN